MYDFDYPTDEDYAYAAKKGLSKKLVYGRWSQGWSTEKAINTPKRAGNKYKKLQQEAHKNGIEISKSAIRSRLNLGWAEEKIVTTPVGKTKRSYWVEIAKKNGIHPTVFDGRYYSRGWTAEEAATKPTRKRKINND